VKEKYMTGNLEQSVQPESKPSVSAVGILVRQLRNVGIVGIMAVSALRRLPSVLKKPAVALVSASALAGSAAAVGVMKLNGDFIRTPDNYRPSLGEVLPEYKLYAGRRLSFSSTYSKDQNDVSIVIDLKDRTISEDVTAREHYRAPLLYRRSSSLTRQAETAVYSWERKNEQRLSRIFEAIAEPSAHMWGYRFDEYKVVCQKNRYQADVVCARVPRNS